VDRGREQRIDHRDELTEVARRLRSRAQVAHVELYHRLSRTVRITHALEDGHDRVFSGMGIDEGTALRLWRAGEQGVHFSAVSGSSRAAIEEAAERALRGPVSDAPDEPGSGAEGRDDHDDVPAPDEAQLVGWLATARERFGQPVAQSWIEAAETVETWITDGEVGGCRSRARGWALLEPEPSERAAGQPLILASRAWNRLDPEGFGRLFAGRVASGPELHEPEPTDAPVLFSPETSATLVSTLIRTGLSFDMGLPVGPGLQVTDAPDEPDALFGGRFDDLGLRASRQAVADGRSLLRLPASGRYRRPSFRDVPVALPAHLVVAPPESAPPQRRWSVHRLAIHVLSAERWILELDATSWKRGEPAGCIRGAHVATGPRELLAGCFAGVGPAAASHRGVLTPALLFEGLAIRA